jgi:hypothetical protein
VGNGATAGDENGIKVYGEKAAKVGKGKFFDWVGGRVDPDVVNEAVDALVPKKCCVNDCFYLRLDADVAFYKTAPICLWMWGWRRNVAMNNNVPSRKKSLHNCSSYPFMRARHDGDFVFGLHVVRIKGDLHFERTMKWAHAALVALFRTFS